MPNEIQRLQTGGRMSKVVIANGVVYLAGQVSDTEYAPIEQQTNETLAKIDKLLALAGIDKTRLLTAMVWLSDARHIDDFNKVWDAWVPVGEAPARACVQSRLAHDGYDVEIAVTALGH
ncbi:RidA family protein [Bradyrhizobium sp. CCGUVB4N]|uniref:RidA family protein n=1 Tax=Bradyrhizobium sp. CCGUVB4N TaxID=2949631 RepID=UPI0020B1DA23|nr:RidA family protein [Bradyrhizobium sp. CCGUVB4N]MCP3380271.1 RidA family protein [Bradyrhizobium sp. CCGUVB4N]